MNKTPNKEDDPYLTMSAGVFTESDFEEYDMTDKERTMLQSLLQEATQRRLDRSNAKYTDQWAHFVSRRQYYYYFELQYKESVNAIRGFMDTMRRKA